MNEILDRIRYSAEQLWQVLPALLGAALIFATGYFVARRLERWIDQWLSRMDFNRMAEAGGLREAVDRTGARLDPVHAVGKLAFWLIMLIVIMLASAALDRLTHGAHFVEITGQSFRAEHTKKQLTARRSRGANAA